MPQSTRFIVVLLFFSPLCVGCGLTPAARERAAANEKRRAEHIEKLKKLVPAGVLKNVDPEFYTYPGFRDWYRIPLVYPYSIICIDDTKFGSLSKHDGKTKIPEGREDQIQGPGKFTALSFDAKFLVGNTDKEGRDPFTEKVIFRWILFEFGTDKIDSFQTKEELSAAAKARGFTGTMELTGVAANYRACFE